MGAITNRRIEVEIGLIISRDFQNISRRIEKSIEPVTRRLSNMRIAFRSGFQAVTKGGHDLKDVMGMTNNLMTRVGARVGMLKKNFSNLGAHLNSFFKRFDGWALSIMFFGMAIQRVFNTIWKQSTKVFQEMAHSIEGVTTPLDMLNGLFKYLMFTVGDALMRFLEPYIPTIVEIVEKVTDWINHVYEHRQKRKCRV